MLKRLTSLLLAAAMLIVCTPPASAQRTLGNPDAQFVLPEKESGIFQRETTDAVLKILGGIIRQMTLGDVDPEILLDLMRQAPLIREGDAPRHVNGNDEFGTLLLLGNFNGGSLAVLETDRPDEYLFVIFYYDAKGNPHWYDIPATYNAKTGLIHGLRDDGLFESGYDFELGQFMVRINANSSSQRWFGFNIFFDALAPLIGDTLDTLRFPFEYNGRDYMIQIWKGIYSWFSNGGDIGIYEKPSGRPIFYDSSDTELYISMQMYRDGAMLYDYGTQRAWWAGGFRLGPPHAQALPRGLSMRASITFEDPAMLEAFLASFEKNRVSGITGTVDGMTFSFIWG